MNSKEKRNSGKKIRSGDQVLVISGNNKGQHGKVLACMVDRVIVQGINVRKKHVKRSEESPQGFVEFERSIHRSNVCLSDEEGNPFKRVRVAFNDNNEKVLTGANKEGERVTIRSMKKAK